MEVNLIVDDDIFLTGTLVRQPSRQGVIVFDDVVFGVLPGTKIDIRISSEPATTTIDDHVTIDKCDSDQVLYERKQFYYCLDEREPAEAVVILVYIGVAIILAISIVFLVLLVWKRRKKPINDATPTMCYSIILGVILCAISVTMWVKAEDAMCALRGWLLGLGLTMIFGAIFVRACRLLWIFGNFGGALESRRVITNLDLGIGVSLLTTLVTIVLVVWMIVAPPNMREVIKIDVSDPEEADNTITYECEHSFPSSVFIIILIVIEALCLTFDCAVAFLTRNIPSRFNESKYVAFTV